MVAKDMAKRLVKKVRRRMVGAEAAAAHPVDVHAQGGADRQLALGDFGTVYEHAGRRLEGVGDARAAAVP